MFNEIGNPEEPKPRDATRPPLEVKASLALTPSKSARRFLKAKSTKPRKRQSSKIASLAKGNLWPMGGHLRR